MQNRVDLGTSPSSLALRVGMEADIRAVEKGDRHRAGTFFGGFGICCGSEPVPLLH